MRAWIGGWSIATRLFVLQLVMIVVLAALAVGWIWADARTDVERDAAAKSMAVAETLAADPYVATALGTPDPSARLQPYAVDVMDEAGIDFITIMAPDRIRYTHPDPSQIGQEFLGTCGVVLFLTMILQRMRPKYQDRSYRYGLLEAGHVGENAYLAASSMGLGACGVGAFMDDAINHMLGVDGVEEAAVYMLAAGHVPTAS